LSAYCICEGVFIFIESETANGALNSNCYCIFQGSGGKRRKEPRLWNLHLCQAVSSPESWRMLGTSIPG